MNKTTCEKLDDRWYAHGGVMQLTRKNVEKLRDIVMPYHNGEKQAKLMGIEFEQAITDELHINEPDSIRNELCDSGQLVPEADSREKLEADVLKKHNYMGPKPYSLVTTYDDVIGWLDRQAAITEREVKLRELYKFEENHRGHIRSIEEVNQKLNERIAELQAKLEDAEYERDRLQEKLDDDWRYVCLKKRVDLYKKKVDELKAERITELRVKLDEGAYLLDRAHPTDAGADIFTPHDVYVPAKGSAVVKTGVHVELPPNTVGMLKSRSGLNVKHGIVSEGVVDEGYTGEVVVKLHNLSESGVRLAKGAKVSQLVVLPVLYPDIVEVDEIEGGPRGDDGFGSTGEVVG